MEAKKFEQQFDENVDLTVSLDVTTAGRALQEQKSFLEAAAKYV